MGGVWCCARPHDAPVVRHGAGARTAYGGPVGASRALLYTEVMAQQRYARRPIVGLLGALLARTPWAFAQSYARRWSVAGLLIALLAPSTLAFAQSSRPVVAVFGLKNKGTRLRKSVIDRMSEYVTTELVRSGRYLAVPNSELKDALAHQKAESYKDCYDEACQIEVGKELAASLAVSGTILKIGRQCIVTLTLIDLRTSAKEAAAKGRGRCTEEGVLQSIDQALAQLGDRPVRQGTAATPDILGVGMKYTLFTRANLDRGWEKAPDKGGKVRSVAIMKDGTIVGVGLKNTLVTRANLDSGWRRAPATGGQVRSVAVMPDGTLLGVGMRYRLYTRAHLDRPWKSVPDYGGKVRSVAVMKDGTILGVSLKYKLLTRANLDSGWQRAPDHGGKIRSVAVMNDGSLLAVGMKYKLHTRADLNSGWQPVPDRGGKVRAIAIFPKTTAR